MDAEKGDIRVQPDIWSTLLQSVFTIDNNYFTNQNTIKNNMNNKQREIDSYGAPKCQINRTIDPLFLEQQTPCSQNNRTDVQDNRPAVQDNIRAVCCEEQQPCCEEQQNNGPAVRNNRRMGISEEQQKNGIRTMGTIECCAPLLRMTIDLHYNRMTKYNNS